MRDIKIHG